MSKSPDARLGELEGSLSRIERALGNVNARAANPLTPRLGWYVGKLDGALSQGGTATVSVYFWDITEEEWVDSGIDLVGRDIYLNEGESVEAGTLVRIEWYRNVWLISNMYCAPTDVVGIESEGG